MLKTITKSIIDDARSLRQHKFRTERQLFIAEGPKVISELLGSGLKVRWVAGMEDALTPLQQHFPGTDYYACAEKELKKMSSLTTPNKMVAVADIPIAESPFSTLGSRSLLLLDGISDPGNLGTILRTAEWFGITSILCSNDAVDCWNPKVVQGAMGSLFRMNVWYGDLIEVVKMATTLDNFTVMGASLNGNPLSETKQHKLFMLAIGSESHGISSSLDSLLPVKIKIPGASGKSTESLNASVACGIILYELNRK